MSRMPRFFVPNLPLHVIQRGNDRTAIFRGTKDFAFYYEGLLRASAAHGVAIHAYILMGNHVHLLATPAQALSVPT
jgi:putative transposase